MPTIIRQSKPIAIKSHRCNFCGEFILKGERYERSLLKWDDLYEWKNHIDCSWIASELNMFDYADDEGFTEEEFRECITDEYAHIMTTYYEDIWEANEFRIPSFAEQLKFVIDYHKKKESMKKFDLEKAKAGEPVITREGKPARILCFDLKSGKYNILYAVDDGNMEFISSCDNSGRSFLGKETPTDLFMASNKKKGWINIYRCDTYVDGHGEKIYHTKEDALNSKGPLNPNYITTIEIEWEE